MICRLAFTLAGGLFASLSLPVAAEVAFLSETSPAPVKQLLEKTRQLTGRDVRLYSLNQRPDAASLEACVVVGQASLTRLQECAGKPAVAVFVTREASAAAEGLTSAIYLDPPLRRQVALAKEILGSDRRLGVLVRDPEQWSLLAQQSDSSVTPYFVNEYDSLNHALVDLLKSNHALVGVYDTKLYSSETIKNILITAYRQNKPLFGPSSAYIKAGALATTYSDLDDVARRLAEILKSGLKEGVWPEADFNPYFGVRFNEQVGRSLNLLLPSPDAMTLRLISKEQR